MYFNNDIKIHNFKNESDFNSCLTCMLRTDSAQKWSNEHTAENECYTMGNPDDTGIFQFDFKTRRLIKNNFYGQWNHDVDHLFFARVDCCNDDILSGIRKCIRKCRQSCVICRTGIIIRFLSSFIMTSQKNTVISIFFWIILIQTLNHKGGSTAII